MVKMHQRAIFCQNRSIDHKDIMIFLIFQDGGGRHLGSSNSQNFIGCRCLEDLYASFYQISSKSVVPLQRYSDFSNFQDGLGFLKSRNCIGYWSPEVDGASVCQISSK